MMPGLFGYTDQKSQFIDKSILNKMRDLLTYTDNVLSEPMFSDGCVSAGYCAPDFENVDKAVTESSGIMCWFDGEIYNIGELTGLYPNHPNHPNYTDHTNRIDCINSIDHPNRTDHPNRPNQSLSIKKLLIEAYQSNILKEVLYKTDGYFSAVIYDSAKRQVKLLADRFGFRHLFYTHYNNRLTWASECKAFIAMPDFKIAVDRRSVDDFMRVGILCDDRTWLDGALLLNPATILTYNCETDSLSTETYRRQDEIHPLEEGKFDANGFYEEWGRLFKRSVLRRTSDSDRAGLTLSGGLDSRAILAAMPPSKNRINAVTLGDNFCDDARFAAMASEIKGANHHVLPLSVDGWLDRAALGIWATDGALGLSSQLGIEHLLEISGLMGVCLNGIGGGRMQGGRVLGTAESTELDKLENGAPGLQMIRRRMLRPGFRLDESFFRVRMPFFDNDLYDLVMAIPKDLRKKGLLYGNALLHNFPDYYKSIPWQQAGVPISLPPLLFKAGTLYKKSLSRIKRTLQRYGLPVCDSKLYYSPSTMLYDENNIRRLEEILLGKDIIYPEYLSKNITKSDIRNGSKTEEICRIATFEIFMRQCRGDPCGRPFYP